MASSTRILIVDDDEVDRMACRRALAQVGAEIDQASNAAEALRQAAEREAQLILLDYRLPDMDGIELMQRLLQPPSTAAVVMLTGADDVSVAVDAMRHGASDYLVKDVQGRYQALIPLVVQRVLREHEMRREKQRAEQDLEAIISSASDAIISADGQGLVTLFNPSAQQVFGCSAAEALGRPIDTFFAPASGRVAGRRADGAAVDLEVSLSRTHVAGRTMLTAIVRDVTQRVQDELALARYRQELSNLTQKLMAQEKATTRRLAQSLHDHLGQTLAAMRLSYDSVQAACDCSIAPAVQRHAARLGGLIDQAVAEVRQVLVDLRPPLLDEQGLAAALDNEMRSRAPAHDEVVLQLEVDAGCEGRRWPADVEYAAFMIAREALANALQHARAATVFVRLTGATHSLSIDVEDDGCGIPDGALPSRPGHLGMVGMRERAVAIGAQCTVGRNAMGGTTASLRWAMA